MSSRLSQQKNIFFTSIVIFVVASFIGFKFIYKSNLVGTNVLKQKIEESKKANILLKEINDIQNDLKYYFQMSMDSSDPEWLLSRVATTAKDCDVKITAINASKAMTEDNRTFFICKVAFDAPYLRLAKFINALEKDKKFIRIDSLSVVPIKVIKKLSLKKGQRNTYINAESEQASTEAIKKSKDEGVWVSVKMDIIGVYYK